MTLFKKHKIFSLFLVFALVFTMLPTAAFAAEATEDEYIHIDECVHETGEVVIETTAESADTSPETEVNPENTGTNSGIIGESNLSWSFDPFTAMLTISGSGGCEAFTSAEDQPWKHLRQQIKEVWFYDVEQLSIENLAYWFEGCTALVTAEVPYTTFIIGENAFADCTSLRHVLMYYMETPPVIADGAFYVDELTVLEFLYIPMAEDANEVLHSHDWTAENRAVWYSDVYGMMTLATGTCGICKVTCSYTLDYEQWTDDVHCVRHWCSNCGYDQCGGVLGESHTMSNGVCTLCGYDDGSGDSGGDSGGSSGGDTTCYHYSSYTSWSGCDWYEYCSNCGEYLNSGTSHGSYRTEWSGCDWYDYCRDCGELMDYGTSHGSYSYGSWEYYSSSQHRRYYSCSDCGEGSYSYGYHSTSTQYGQYSSTQHQKGSYCSTCGSYVGSTSYENHSVSYGSWSNYSNSQHRRTKTCSTCGYSTYEYASHSLSYGSWSSNGASQHKRTVSCSCGYSTTEYANHNTSNGSWSNYSASQHRRTVSCSTCGYSTYEYASHSVTTGNWSSISDTQHSRTKSCSCGYSTTETAAHALTYGSWASYNDTQHRRSATCSCGYSGYSYENHSHTASSEVKQKDDAQHIIVSACACGHTVEEAENHTFKYEEWRFHSETEHNRGFFCDCGYSSTEYAEHKDNNGDDYCDSCGYLMSRFSVTVPATLNLTVAKDGTVYAATTAQIVNNSTDTVSVTSIKLNTENGWQLVPYSTNMANAKVDARLIGFYLNGAESDGTENLPMSHNWQIAKDDALTLDYDAVVSATSDPINEQVLTIVFVLDWAE